MISPSSLRIKLSDFMSLCMILLLWRYFSVYKALKSKYLQKFSEYFPLYFSIICAIDPPSINSAKIQKRSWCLKTSWTCTTPLFWHVCIILISLSMTSCSNFDVGWQYFNKKFWPLPCVTTENSLDQFICPAFPLTL